MKRFFKFIWNVILYIWQLPQNIVGLIVRLLYPSSVKVNVMDIPVWYNKNFPGGISLGNTVIVCSTDLSMVLHEHGHQIQSKMLGPLYLLVIGLPSIIWAMLYGTVIPMTFNGYYKFYTERSADRLGGVIRY